MNKLLLLFLIFSHSIVYSAVCTSNAGTFASWAAVTWSCSSAPIGGPPGCGDVINIAAGTTVNISADVNYSGCGTPITLNIYGTLNFNTNGVQFRLPPGSTVFVGAGGSINKTFPGGGSSTLISVGGVNVWTAGSGTVTGPLVLPIDLLTFTANQNGSAVEIKWATASEQNNDYFTIEKTKDFLNFETVSLIDGSGNSYTIIHYQATDKAPYQGLTYYRLKQTDYNGDFKNFPFVAVEFKSKNEFSFDIYPNPTSGEKLNLKLNSEIGQQVIVVVYDITGKESYSKILITDTAGESVYAVDASNELSAGIYIITATSNQNIYSKRLIVK